MDMLRRILYVQAGLWALTGAALGLVPRFVLHTLFNQTDIGEYAWVRLAGVLLVGLALFMVLVAHRVEELWWWSWGFVITTGATAALFTINAAFGVEAGDSSVLWWSAALLSWGLASGMLIGLAGAAREKPLERFEPAPARKPRPARP